MKGKNLTLVISTIIAATLLSCEPKKNKYYFAINGRELMLTEQFSDSAAYMHAFESFEITKKVYKDMDDVMKDNVFYTKKDVTYFDLFNEKLENITYIVDFKDKDSLKAEAVKYAKKLPNNFKQLK
jgi:hypothetical protein